MNFPDIYCKFKGNSAFGEDVMQYRVHELNVMAYDKLMKKEVICHKIDALGYVCADRLEIIEPSIDNIPAMEVLDILKFKKSE